MPPEMISSKTNGQQDSERMSRHSQGSAAARRGSEREERRAELSEHRQKETSTNNAGPDDHRGHQQDGTKSEGPLLPDIAEIQQLGRGQVANPGSTNVYQDFSASDLPGIRFSRWGEFKNRFEYDDFSGIAVEALIGPPNLRNDMIVDEYRRALSNASGTIKEFPSGLQDFGNHTANQPDSMVHRVRILSSSVRRRLSSLANSSVDWTIQPVTFVRPFRELIYYYEKIKTELDDAAETTSRTISVQDELELSNYINFMEKVILPLKARWDPSQPSVPGKIRFVDLSYIFRPGELLYRQDDRFGADGQPHLQRIGMLLACEVAAYGDDFTDKIWDHIELTWNRRCTLHVIHLDFDGRAFRPVIASLQMKAYEGEKDIRSLTMYPLRFEPDAAKIQSGYQEYGRKFKSFCSNRRHWFHTGWTLDWVPPLRNAVPPPGRYRPSGPYSTLESRLVSEFIDSEVIVDFQEALRSLPEWKPAFLDPIDGNRTAGTETSTDMWPILTWADQVTTTALSRVSETVVYSGGLELEDENAMAKLMPILASGTAQEDELEELQLALLPRRVFAYSLRDRKFVLAHVDSLSEIKYVEGGFKNLRINDAHLRMIKSLVKNHFNTKRLEGVEGVELVGQDFIYGKGRGVVVLLHGVPGVGKTATAEAVAQEYAKPLFPMTCGDLGTTPEVVSKTLMNIFRLANLWECVLLLDEADVFLSRREQRSNDLLRNALVSVFLRVLEYYSGVLFLTTNRPGVLDEAVKSRVHASFFYPHLGWNQTRDIFELNVERLRRIEEQRAKYGEEALVIIKNQVMKFAEEHYHNHKDNEGRWNGRQIRNAFQIAAGLAHLDGEEASEATEEGVVAAPGAGGSGVQRQLGRQHFEEVTDAILKYDQFRAKVLGKYDDEVAKDRNERPEEFPEGHSEGSIGHGQRGSMTRDYGALGSYERHGRYDGGGGHRGF